MEEGIFIICKLLCLSIRREVLVLRLIDIFTSDVNNMGIQIFSDSCRLKDFSNLFDRKIKVCRFYYSELVSLPIPLTRCHRSRDLRFYGRVY